MTDNADPRRNLRRSQRFNNGPRRGRVPDPGERSPLNAADLGTSYWPLTERIAAGKEYPTLLKQNTSPEDTPTPSPCGGV